MTTAIQPSVPTDYFTDLICNLQDVAEEGVEVAVVTNRQKCIKPSCLINGDMFVRQNCGVLIYTLVRFIQSFGSEGTCLNMFLVPVA